MDTDYLTEEAYDVLIRDSYEVSDILGAEIAAMSMEYEDEPEYIEGAKKHIRGIIRDTEDYLDGWNLLDEIDSKEFRKKLRGLLEKITALQNIPYEKRKQSE